MKNPIKVKKKYRTNPLSHTPGGVTVTVKLKDGTSLQYDNVKYPNGYINKLRRDPQVLYWTISGKNEKSTK